MENAPQGGLPAEYFQQVPNQLVNDLCAEKIKALDIAVYMVFAHHLGEHTSCWPSNTRVAKLLGTSSSTVIRSIRRLCRTGYLGRSDYSKYGTKHTALLVRVKEGKIVRERRTSSPSLARPLVPLQTSRPANSVQVANSCAKTTSPCLEAEPEQWDEESNSEEDVHVRIFEESINCPLAKETKPEEIPF